MAEKKTKLNENVQSLVFICFPCLVLKTSVDVRFNLLCKNIYLHTASIMRNMLYVRYINWPYYYYFAVIPFWQCTYISILASKIGICIVELKMRREFECWKYESTSRRWDEKNMKDMMQKIPIHTLISSVFDQTLWLSYIHTHTRKHKEREIS